MTILNILNYPDPRLHTVATSVAKVTDQHKKLIMNMAETMYKAPGIGLAATQVNHHERIIVIDISENKDNLLVLVNPEILEKKGEQLCEEGCLSLPGVYEKVSRAEWVKIKALDTSGKQFIIETDGLLSVCIQHEMDHLLGKVFVEYLSPLKKSRIRLKMLKQSKQRKTP